MHIGRAAAATMLFVALGATAQALPRPGEPFPRVEAEDITGQERSTDELKGQRVLLVAITDREAGHAAGDWYMAADTQVPANFARHAIVSLRLPFFISTTLAQRKAREKVPRQYWQGTLLDRGGMAKQLGLQEGQVPYIFVLDENGRVIASVHATVDSPEAETIWNALGRR